MKNIWIINHYAELPRNGVMTRHYNFAKQLVKEGYNVTVFTSSAIHNSNYNSINDASKYKIEEVEGAKFVHIKTINYIGNRIGRIRNILQFYFGMMKKGCKIKELERPNAIIGSSAHPLSAIAAIQLSKRYKCQSIVEIRDLWPESLVAYGIISEKNPLLRLLYEGEKWIYKNADKIVFTMEGGRDYITEHGWDIEQGGSININKVHHINNGVDLEVFNYNKEHYQFDDEDLDNSNTFKIVYAGSIRKVNKLSILIEVAKELEKENILFLIWGDGDEKEVLANRCKNECINNIIFKGHVDKKYIPSILSRADINLIHGGYTSIMEYGMSANKMFEYIAAQKPILSDLKTNYDIIKKYKLGLVIENQNYKDICNGILELRNNSEENIAIINKNLIRALKEFTFEELTNKLINLLNMEGEN